MTLHGVHGAFSIFAVSLLFLSQISMTRFTQHKNKEDGVHPVQLGYSTAPSPQATVALQMRSKSDTPKPRGNPSWGTKGINGRSGNEKGRPRSGLAQAELIRELLDPAVGIEIVQQILAAADIPLERKLAAYLSLADRGYIRPPAGVDVHVSQGDAGLRSLAHLSDAELEQRLAWLRGDVRELPAAEAQAGEGEP